MSRLRFKFAGAKRKAKKHPISGSSTRVSTIIATSKVIPHIRPVVALPGIELHTSVAQTHPDAEKRLHTLHYVCKSLDIRKSQRFSAALSSDTIKDAIDASEATLGRELKCVLRIILCVVVTIS